MARTPQTKGICQFCRREIAKAGVVRHLAACEPWQGAMAEAERSGRKTETLHHLRVQAAGLPQFWLDLEMRGSAKLQDLDKYLRAIWLECCGHMSQFSFGGGRRGNRHEPHPRRSF
jgi:hypothetical protein